MYRLMGVVDPTEVKVAHSEVTPEVALTVFQTAIACLKQGWTQGGMARDADGALVPYWDPNAENYCSVGAIAKAALPSFPGKAVLRGSDLARYLSFDSLEALSSWNDKPNRTQEEVLELFEKAKERAELELPKAGRFP